MDAGGIIPDVLEKGGGAIDTDVVQSSSWQLKARNVLWLKLKCSLSPWY